MPFYFYIWDGENDRHIASHDISREEFEQVVSRPVRSGRSRTTGRPAALGQTDTGRWIFAVYELIDETTVYPVTAYEKEI